MSLAVSGLQVFGVIGSLAELIADIDPGKAAGLRAMGIDPTLAVTINLAYAAASCCLVTRGEVVPQPLDGGPGVAQALCSRPGT